MFKTFMRTLPVLALVISGINISTALASDSGVNISAKVLAPACTIATDSVNQTVDLGKGRIADLNKANDATDWTSFTVELTACPASVTQVVSTLSGVPDESNPAWYFNSGTATGVAVDVMDEAGQVQLSNGKTLTTGIDEKHTARLAMKARMVTGSGNTTPGTVTSLMQFTLSLK